MENITDTLNNAKDLTILQFLKIIIRLKFKTVAALSAAIITFGSGAFALGRYSYQEKTAVLLDSPFSMRLSIDGADRDFKNLILIEDPVNIPDKSVLLTIREIQSAFDIVPIGKIVARKEKIELPGVWGVFGFRLINEARANDNFNWNGHECDFNFKETFVDKVTIHRYYEDGCILEYKVSTEKRSSERDSFRWIKIVH